MVLSEILLNQSTPDWKPFDSLQTCILVIDRGSKIRYLNESAEILVGDSLSRVFRKPLSSVFVEAISDNQLDSLARAYNTSLQTHSKMKLFDLELLVPSLRKTCSVDCDVGYLSVADEPFVLLEIHPKKQQNLSVVSSDQVKRKQSIIKGIAHEIRNPLGGIRGAAQLLQSDLGDSDLVEYTEIIISEADRLSRLVERMHATSSIGAPQTGNIHKILERVDLLIRSEFVDGFDMKFDYDPSLPEIMGDEDQLVQATLNIARNAIQACLPQQGKSIITFRSRIDSIVGEDDRHNKVVRVDIEDNGSGISPNIRDHIFEPMVTTRPSGTGLGLSISAEIIRVHNGALTVESEPGYTKFSIYLPISR